MKEGPNIAGIATLIGNPARANMLQALMTGVALTASELAQEAGVTPQTSSFHLRRLAEAGLITLRKQGGISITIWPMLMFQLCWRP